MLGKPRIRLNNLKTSLRFSCLGKEISGSFADYLNLMLGKLRIRLNILKTSLRFPCLGKIILGSFLDNLSLMLGKHHIRLNNLKISLRFHCLGLNSIIDSINHCCSRYRELIVQHGVCNNINNIICAARYTVYKTQRSTSCNQKYLLLFYVY